jgi:hypothetical protein
MDGTCHVSLDIHKGSAEGGGNSQGVGWWDAGADTMLDKVMNDEWKDG